MHFAQNWAEVSPAPSLTAGPVGNCNENFISIKNSGRLKAFPATYLPHNIHKTFDKSFARNQKSCYSCCRGRWLIDSCTSLVFSRLYKLLLKRQRKWSKWHTLIFQTKDILKRKGILKILNKIFSLIIFQKLRYSVLNFWHWTRKQ